MNEIIKNIEAAQLKAEVPEFNTGDTVRVHALIKEGNRERVQIFEGTVLKKQGGSNRATFTVRKNSNGVGVEKTWPLHSPHVVKVEVIRRGKVRRAKLNYLRDRVGKAAKVKEHVALASLAPDLFTISFNGLSKSHRVAGYRVGWMCLCGNKSNVKGYIEGLNLLSSMRLCSNVPAQSIVQTCLGGYQSADELLLPGGRIYDQREYIYKALCDIPGISVVKPEAAFYIFPKLDKEKFNITNDEQFALDLLRDKHILVTCGTGFNWKDPDHFRIVYLPNMEILKAATAKLADFLSYYHQ